MSFHKNEFFMRNGSWTIDISLASSASNIWLPQMINPLFLNLKLVDPTVRVQAL
jgi:hypothetical protein